MERCFLGRDLRARGECRSGWGFLRTDWGLSRRSKTCNFCGALRSRQASLRQIFASSKRLEKIYGWVPVRGEYLSRRYVDWFWACFVAASVALIGAVDTGRRESDSSSD